MKHLDRPYSHQDVIRLRGSLIIEHTLAKQGALIFRDQLMLAQLEKKFVSALGAVTGNQAIQQVQAGLKAIYLSGWQVAADANLAGQMYPDQSLYPANSAPALVKAINNALTRADQIQGPTGNIFWFVPIIADAEAGFGGPLNAFEITKAFIEAGAAAVHFEDQLSSAKKCGHMGGKVLVPTSEFIQKLIAARLASDVLDVPTVIIARTDANGAKLITSEADPRDWQDIDLEAGRTSEGYYHFRGGIRAAIERGLAYAPYADMLWCETSEPNLEEARIFAEGIHDRFPSKPLAYNLSPSFNWKEKLGDRDTIFNFQHELAKLGYVFQFVTLAGFHSLNHGMFDLARKFVEDGMLAYSDFQEEEFESTRFGYTAVKHQKFVGTSYFDDVVQVIAGGQSSTTALKGSTEEEQF